MLDDEPKASRTEPTMQLYEFDPVLVWTRRLALYARWRMWMPEWGRGRIKSGAAHPMRYSTATVSALHFA